MNDAPIERTITLNPSFVVGSGLPDRPRAVSYAISVDKGDLS